jgi:hypothetical protein
MDRPGRLRQFLRRWSHFAHVRSPKEIRMGSPQYGELILDGKPIARSIEHESLTWSNDRRLLAAQQFVSGLDGPRTRIVVFDAERRVELAATPAVDGLSDPIRFDDDVLVYRHWHHRRGEQELELPLPSDSPAD